MVRFSPILIFIIFPAAVLGSYNENVLDYTERRVTLNSFYAEFIAKFLPQTSADETDTFTLPIKIEKLSAEEFLAALAERHEAIELNVHCWMCAMYYTLGKQYGWGSAEKKEDLEKAKRCAAVAEVLAWHNENFAKQISALKEVFDKEKIQEPNNEQRFYMADKYFADINSVSDELQKANNVLIKANLKYKDIFKKILPQYTKNDKITVLEEAFIIKSWALFAEAINAEAWYAMDVYMWNLLDGFGMINFKNVVRPTLDEFIAIWDAIQTCTIAEKKFFNVKYILSLENDYIRSRLTANEIQPPQNFGQRKWRIETTDEGQNIDYQFRFEKSEDDNDSTDNLETSA